MKKCISNTPYICKHDIFRERLKSLCKDKHITYAGLGLKIGYTEDTIKGWSKAGGGFPNMRKLVELSCIFDVDVAYLLGDQSFKKVESQRIHDLSGLNELASNVIESTKNNERDIYVLNKLLTHEKLPRLLESIFQYAICHNVEFKMENKTLSVDNFFLSTESQKKAAFKFTATDTFSEILEDLYNENKESMDHMKGKTILKEMFILIHQWTTKNEKNTDEKLEDLISESKEALLKAIKATLKTLPEHPVYNIVKQFSPEDVLKKYKEISKLLGIEIT